MSNFNFNKMMLGGRLTSDVELRQTPKGDSVVSGSIAVNRRMKGADGTYPTDFFSFVAWHKNAELIAKHFKKGSSILLIGEMQNRSYVDKQGVKRYASDLIVDEVRFVDSKEEREGFVPPSYASSGNVPKFEEIGVDEDLPF